MRLLSIRDGNISVTRDLPDAQAAKYQYAILSHTCVEPEDEVTFDDLHTNDYHQKPGYEKIRFCFDQASRDGLDHIWVDTCCIDKRSLYEFDKAIRLMYRWYSRASKCYVWLSDTKQLSSCRWITRGWALPELLAPTEVEFFHQGLTIGTKVSLENEISTITGIPISALRGKALMEFTVAERFRWQAGRQTTEEEDLIYSMLGMFGMNLTIMYGEGVKSARIRLVKELDDAHMHPLAPCSYNSESLEEAETAYIKALAVKHQVPGCRESALETKHHLAVIYRRQDKLAESERLLEQTLQARALLLGPGHPSTLESCHELGILLKMRGNDKCREMLQRAFDGRSSSLGTDHESTLLSLAQINAIHRDQGRLGESEETYMRIFKSFEVSHGQDHPATLGAMHDLALLYLLQYNFESAEEILKRALAGRESILGHSHELTIDTVISTGCMYAAKNYLHRVEADFRLAARRQKQTEVSHQLRDESSRDTHDKAKALFHRALKARKTALGPEHSSTLHMMHLMNCLEVENHGDVSQTESSCQRVFQGYERIYGRTHKLTMDVQFLVASIYEKQDNTKKAQELYLQLADGYERTAAPAELISTRIKLSNIYTEQGHIQQAEQTLLQALHDGEIGLGLEHLQVMIVVETLFMMYVREGKARQARELYLRVKPLRADMTRAAQGFVDTMETLLPAESRMPGWMKSSLRQSRTWFQKRNELENVFR